MFRHKEYGKWNDRASSLSVQLAPAWATQPKPLWELSGLMEMFSLLIYLFFLFERLEFCRYVFNENKH